MTDLAAPARSAASGGLPRFGKTSLIDPLEATIAQQRWMAVDATPAKASSNIAVELLISGEFDIGVFREAAQVLVDRHTVLRTIFAPWNGSWRQSIIEHRVEIDEVELGAFANAAEMQEAIWTLLRELRARATDLTQDAPIHFTVIPSSPTHRLLSLVVHHIALDDASWKSLLPELWYIYDALANGRTPALGETLQYYDYANWEVALRAASPSVWNEARPFDIIELPVEAERTNKAYPRGALAVQLDAARTTRLRAMTRKVGVTVPTFILHAYSQIFAEWSGKDRFTLPYLIHGRPIGAENIIGQFAQIRPYQAVAASAADPIGALQAARASFGQSSAARNLLPTKVGQEIGVERMLLNLIKGNTIYSGAGKPPAAPTAKPDAAPAAAPPQRRMQLAPYRPVRPLRTTIRLEMNIMIHETAQTLAGNIAFANELYTAEQIAKVIDRFEQLVESHCDAAGV